MALRYYPAFIVQDEDEAAEGFGAVFPDLPGCVSAGKTVEETAEMAAEALALHIEGMVEDGLPLPPPSPPGAMPDWLREAPGRTITSVLVPVELPGRSVRANITLDEALLGRLDAAAAAEGVSRSGYIAAAIRERLRGDKRAA